jgi:hypothetical protein
LKKIWILGSLILMLVCSMSVQAGDYASNALRLPYGKNYLDLRNMQRTDPRDIDMFTHIRIKKNVTYTLVMDLAYIGVDNFSQDEYPYFTHCEKVNVNCQIQDINVDLVNERWYYSFVSSVETLIFKDIPAMATEGYNIMLYEGTYAQFTGFEYYVSNAPIMYSGVYLVDIDSPARESDIRGKLSVSDPKGGPIKMELMGGNYNDSNPQLGEYVLQYRATDAMTNTSYFEMVIKVIDRTKPSIDGIDFYNIEHGTPWVLNDILRQLTVSDNVSNLTTSNIVVKSDNYSTSNQKTGTYEIVLSLKDDSLNETTKTIQIRVTDTKPPMIYGPDVIYTYLSDGPRTLEQITSLYTAIDNHDGDITNKILIQLSDYNGTLIKNHTIYVRCTDAAGNQTLRTVHLHVIDDTAPIFHTTEYVLSIDVYEEMTRDEVIAWLESQLHQSGVSPRNIKILLDETEHLQSKRSQAFIYYSYEIDGVSYQSRIAVNYTDTSHTADTWVYVIISVAVTLSGGFFGYKKFKKR